MSRASTRFIRVLALLHGFVGFGGDLVAHVPEVFVEKMFHALVQDFDRRAHGAHHSATDDSLRQLQMVKAEQVYALVKIQQTLGDVVQTEEFLVAAIDVVHADAGLAKLSVKRFSRGAGRCAAGRGNRANRGRCRVRGRRE